MNTSPLPLLDIHNLQAGYGKTPILHGVGLSIEAGEIVALLGRNGSGRSTTAKAIMGMVEASGALYWKGKNITRCPPFERAQLGLGYVPENRDVFPQLTVAENLWMGQKKGKKNRRWNFSDMYQLFPRLKEREHTPAGVLSGGEQQMLTLCRTLMGDPDCIVIDEPTEGLAPQIVAQVALYLEALRQRGVAVLLIEQKLTIALEIAQRCLVMGQGRIVFEGTPSDLRNNAVVRKEWLEV
ncbi:MAG: hypothetical protein RLZZ495_241 [Pseudomonadota bacterium]|jgi:branched-chain amino acid transport system ATP-binding protein